MSAALTQMTDQKTRPQRLRLRMALGTPCMVVPRANDSRIGAIGIFIKVIYKVILQGQIEGLNVAAQ